MQIGAVNIGVPMSNVQCRIEKRETMLRIQGCIFMEQAADFITEE